MSESTTLEAGGAPVTFYPKEVGVSSTDGHVALDITTVKGYNFLIMFCHPDQCDTIIDMATIIKKILIERN